MNIHTQFEKSLTTNVTPNKANKMPGQNIQYFIQPKYMFLYEYIQV